MLRSKQLERRLDRVGALELGMFERPPQVQVICTALEKRNTNALAIHVDLGAEHGSGGDEVGGVDQEIGAGKGDITRAKGVGSNQPHVPGVGVCVIGEFTGALVEDEAHGNTEAPCELAGQVGRYA
ncbi:hypothetical protein D3C72_1447280 [compost metagenome]